jgi:hypothetical protein
MPRWWKWRYSTQQTSIAQQVFPSGHAARAKDREGGDGPETCSPPLLDVARGMGLRAVEEVRFATSKPLVQSSKEKPQAKTVHSGLA